MRRRAGGGCTTYYLDADQDGAGVTAQSQCLTAPTGLYTASEGGDVDDANCLINPDMAWFLNSRSGSYGEWCLNGTDDDRDGATDNACDVHYQSRGTDGAGNPTATGWFDRDGDGYFTVATETLPVWFDACLAATTFTASTPDAGVTGDCDNLDLTVHPGAQDLCDGIDQDCDGADGLPEICSNSLDDDCDGVVNDGCP